MSATPKRVKKSGKRGSLISVSEEEDITITAKSAPTITTSQATNESPERPERHEARRSSGSSEASDADSPRSMVHGMIEMLGSRVSTQLQNFLNNEVQGLLTVARAEIVQQFQLEIDDIRQSYEKQILELKERLDSQQKVQQKQDAWMAIEASVLEDALKKQNEYVVLNVGGVEYATSKGTLLKYPNSMLGAMFSGRYQSLMDPQGRYFIDRDGELFRHILGFLRTDSLSTIDVLNTNLMLEILQEATYFQIEPLVNVLTSMVSAAETPSSLQSYRARMVRHQSSISSTGTPSHESNGLSPHDRRNGRESLDKNRSAKPSSSSAPAYLSLNDPSVYTRSQIHGFKLQHAAAGLRTRLNLAGLDLSGIDLSRLDLCNVDFSRCILVGASFEMANLVGCNFSQAVLRQVNFQQASFGNNDIECPDFTDADLQGANFTRYSGVLYRNRFEGVEDEMIGLELRWLRG